MGMHGRVGLGVCGNRAQEALISGQPLSVRANGGVGLLAAPSAIKSVPVGCAKVFGGKRPDLFVFAPTGVDRAFLLYRWVRDTPDGQPIFAPPVKVIQPFGDRNPPDGTIVQDAAGAVHCFWIKDRKLSHCLFDRDTLTFKQLASVELKGLPRPATAVTVLGLSETGIDIVASCYNGATYRPDGDAKSLDYVLYDGTGAFKGQWPRTGLYRCRLSADGSALTEPVRLFSSSTNGILGGVTLATVAYPGRAAPCVIAGASIGNFYAFDADQPQAQAKRTLFGPDGVSLRHPTIGAAPFAYPNAAGQPTGLIAGGEGALYYYAFSGTFNAEGHPLYRAARPVWQEQATLYAGSLAVPNVTDWDGDGVLDLLIGTTRRGCIPNPESGLPWTRRSTKENGLQVLFLRNAGSNAEPRYQTPKLFQFKGKDLYLGGHSNAPKLCPFGDTSKGPHLLIGAEDGRIYFFEHGDLTFDPR